MNCRFLSTRGSTPFSGLLLCAWLLLSGCASLIEPDDQSNVLPKQFQERQIIVTLPTTDEAKWNELAQAIATDYNLTRSGAFPLKAIGVQCLVFALESSQSINALVSRLNADPRVSLAQENQIFDSLQARSSIQYMTLQYGVRLINALQVQHRSTGRGVRVAVVDTGLARDHPDLKTQIFQTMNFVEHGAKNFDRDRHGTAVAGIIAAHADDGFGIVGVAPDAQLLALKACWYPELKNDQALCSSWTLAKAIDFAINADSQILNMSLAGPSDPLLTWLIEAAVARDITVVAATASGHQSPGFPASLDNVIAAIACNANGLVNTPEWGAFKQPLAAPGIEILSTAPDESYDFFSGSSLAAAHISGIVALLLEQQPNLTPAEIRKLLLNTASHPTDSVALVDACTALAGLIDQLNCSET